MSKKAFINPVNQKKRFKYCFVLLRIMHTVTLKLQENTFRKVERAMKNFDYSTKTDFIREAIRDKLKELEREKAWKKFEKLKGAAPKKYSEDETKRIWEKIGEEFMKKLQY